MGRGVEGTPNWAQDVMTICVVLFRGNVGFLSLIRGEYIFYADSTIFYYLSKGENIYFMLPIGIVILYLLMGR